jgi:hypothetical protein
MSDVFVFGSNLAGRHGAGAALYARRNHGAIYGIGVGRQNNSYAIPTKDCTLNSLPLPVIEHYVYEFLEYAIYNPQDRFIVTAIGTGLAGFTVEQIAPMFSYMQGFSNVVLPAKFLEYYRRVNDTSI